jgi:diaminopimelate decarboxylase
VNAVPAHLLPDNARIRHGMLEIAGVPVSGIVNRHGTPLYVYDEEHMRTRCREAVAEFGTGRVVYATKAFLCRRMAKLVHEEGLMLDVASGGELHTVLAAGVPASSCVLHGNNKSTDELRAAITAGVDHIVVDSFDELDRLDVLHASGLPAPRVHIRVTPGVHAETHEFVSTGQDDSKFGFNLANGDADRAVARAAASGSVELVGLHCHIGSNVLNASLFEQASALMVEMAARCGLPELTLGGGLGVPYVTGDSAPTMKEWGAAIRSATASLPAGTVVRVEPGRSIVATAGITVYTVGTVKSIPGVRDYVAVDGGMSDNIRPMLYGSRYEVFDPDRADAERTHVATLVGKHCESGDVLIEDALLPEGVKVGDLLAVPVTGAYGHSMASNYNRLPRPAVVFADDGDAYLAVRRETYEDLDSRDLG